MDKRKNQEAAEQLFKDHPDKEIVYFTSDGFAFFEKQNAESHAFNLEDKSLDAEARPQEPSRSLLDGVDGGDDSTGGTDTTTKTGTATATKKTTPASSKK